jgi:predicted metal-dependent enzyme (double-stranded beta helix superfamily)
MRKRHEAARSPLSPLWLEFVVTTIASRPGDWEHLVRFDPEAHWRTRLRRDEDHEAWLVSWLPGQRTGLHDHGGSAGAFLVVSGTLTEHTPVLGGFAIRARSVAAGSARSFGPRHVHDVVNASPSPAVSVHVYSTPLTDMRRYEVSPSGLVPADMLLAAGGW